MPEPRDIGEETQRFQAFQDQADDSPSSWKTGAGGSKVIVIAVIVVVVLVLAVILGLGV